MADDEYIDLQTAAEELGIARATLWNAIKARGIQTYRRTGVRRTLMRRADLAPLAIPQPTNPDRPGRPRWRGRKPGGESNAKDQG